MMFVRLTVIGVYSDNNINCCDLWFGQFWMGVNIYCPVPTYAVYTAAVLICTIK